MGCGSSNQVYSINKLKTLLPVTEFKALYDPKTGRLPARYKLLEAVRNSSGKIYYDKGHIRDAVVFDLTLCSVEKSKLYPRNITDKNKFAAYVGSLGISNHHHVIVYDRSDYGFNAAPRLWWMFRLLGHENVSVLNGGLNKWISKEGQASLTTDIPQIKRQKFSVNYNESFVVKYEYMIKNVESRRVKVIDTRAKEEFKGLAPSVVPDGKLGHIPNSVNIPHLELINRKTGLLKSKEQLLQVFHNAGVDIRKPVVMSCLTGVTACTGILAAYVCGYDNVPLYNGSWFEWSQLAPKDKCIKN